jgi:hypothetical protein
MIIMADRMVCPSALRGKAGWHMSGVDLPLPYPPQEEGEDIDNPRRQGPILKGGFMPVNVCYAHEDSLAS